MYLLHVNIDSCVQLKHFDLCAHTLVPTLCIYGTSRVFLTGSTVLAIPTLLTFSSTCLYSGNRFHDAHHACIARKIQACCFWRFGTSIDGL